MRNTSCYSQGVEDAMFHVSVVMGSDKDDNMVMATSTLKDCTGNTKQGSWYHLLGQTDMVTFDITGQKLLHDIRSCVHTIGS